MPDYSQAQKQLDVIAADWQRDIDSKQAALDKMYKDYDAEMVMLSDDLKKRDRISCFKRKRSLGIFSVNVLALKATSLRKGRSL